MPVLEEQPIPLRFARLGGDVDPKSGAKGQCELLENTQSLRLEDGGVEIEKRPGTPSLSTSIFGGGNISTGAKIAALGLELVATDGLLLYSWSPLLAAWVKKGKVTSVAAQIDKIASNLSGGSNTDVAVANGLACITTRNGVYYVQELATGQVVAQGFFGSESRMRVVAVGNDFYIFSVSVANLKVRKITGATPASISAASVVSAAAGSVYDVCVDVGNARMVVAFRDTTLNQTTICIWTTAMALGTSVTYVTRNPDTGVGFLTHDFSDGNGYVAIGTSATGVRVLTFGRSSMTVTVDTLVDGAVVTATLLTGYFSTVRNVFYQVPGASSPLNKVNGWTLASGTFTVAGSRGLGSRAFKIATKWYIATIFASAVQGHLYLLELDQDAAGANGCVSLAGYLVAGNNGGQPALGVMTSVPALSSTKVLLTGTTLDAGATSIAAITLTWGDTLLGAPVAHNGVLAIPGACGKIYDGNAVYEQGFLLWPEAPTATAGAGGSLTLLATYEYLVTWECLDDTGRLWRSSAGFITTTTLTGANNKYTVDVPQLRITERTTVFNIATPVQVTVKLWRTAGKDTHHLVSSAVNDPSSDTVAFVDTLADTTVAANEQLYTDDNELENITPPAVLAYGEHRARLAALSGDGAAWVSKEVQDGLAVGFSSDIRIPFDPAGGPFTGLLPLDQTLVVGQRAALWGITGEGPNLDGSNPYPYPVPLPGAPGLLGPRSFVVTPDGAIVKTAKGVFMLDRAGGVQNLPGSDVYNGLTVTGGVRLDDRTMAVLTTSDGRSLCWDWLLKTWHTWTGQPAVANCIWQNKFTWIEANGKVHVETPGAFADDAGAYAMVVQLSWIDMVHAYLKRIELIGEAFGTCTLQALSSYDYDEANVDTLRSWALSVAGPKSPWILEPDQGYCEAYNLKLTETSTTQGVKLAKLVAWVGLLSGSHKHAPAQYAT
jgi:hypothetical protein